MIPLGHDRRFRVGVPAERGMSMGVALVPCLSMGKEGQGQQESGEEVFHQVIFSWVGIRLSELFKFHPYFI